MSSTKDRSKSSRRCRRNCKDAPANRKTPIRSKVSPGPPGPLPVSADGPATKANDPQDRSPCATDCSALMPSPKAISSKQMCAHASPQGEREVSGTRRARTSPRLLCHTSAAPFACYALVRAHQDALQKKTRGTSMEIGYFAMPSHPPECGLKEGHDWDLQVLRWLDELGYQEAWIGEHHTAPWEPHPAPDLLLAQAFLQTMNIRLGPGGFLLPYHHPAELANRVAMLDHLSGGRL